MSNRYKALYPNRQIMNDIIARNIIYQKYLNGLMLIHDFGATVSSLHGPARLTETDRLEMWERTLNDIRQFGQSVEQNLESNFQIVKNLVDQFNQSENKNVLRAIQMTTDEFLDDVVRIYTQLRQLKRIAGTDQQAFRQALAVYQQSLTIETDYENRLQEENILGQLGNVYMDMGEYEQAISHFQQALAIAQDIGDRRGEGTYLSNIGNAYRNLGQYELAIHVYETARSLYASLSTQEHAGDAVNMVDKD